MDLLNSEGGILVLKRAGVECFLYCIHDNTTIKIHISDLLMRLKDKTPVFLNFDVPARLRGMKYSEFSEGEKLSPETFSQLVKNLEKILLVEILQESSNWESTLSSDERNHFTYQEAKKISIERIFEKYQEAVL